VVGGAPHQVSLTLPDAPIMAGQLEQAVRQRCDLDIRLPLLMTDVKNGEFQNLYISPTKWVDPRANVHLYQVATLKMDDPDWTLVPMVTRYYGIEPRQCAYCGNGRPMRIFTPSHMPYPSRR